MAFTGATSILGQGRQVTATGTAQRNGTALPPGKYLLHVGDDTGATGVHVRFGAADVVATTSDLHLGTSDYLEFIIPSDPTLQYLSLIRRGSTSLTVTIAGNDEQTAKSQPPAWS